MAKQKFQHWYRHDIDSWQGSSDVAALSHAGYRAYHNLLMFQFQQPDGMLPEGIDDRTLAKRSRVFADWEECREEVLELYPMAPNGRRFNVRMFNEWNWAREKHGDSQAKIDAMNDAREARRLAAEEERNRRASDKAAEVNQNQGNLPLASPSPLQDVYKTSTSSLPRHNTTLHNNTLHNTTVFADARGSDVSQLALRIACAHPKSRLKMLQPIEVGSFEQRSIVNAIVAEASAAQGTMEMAAEYILSTVEQITKETPADQVRYVPDVAKFFDNREYRKPTNSWSGRNGANSGRFGTNTDRTVSGLADFLGADALPKVDSSAARGARDGTPDDSIEAGLPAFHGGINRLRESGHPRGGKGNVIDATL